MKRRKHETYADFVEALRCPLRFQIRLDPQGFQDIRTSHFARDADVSMFGNRNAGPGNNQCCSSRNIESLRPAAAGAARVDPPVVAVSGNRNATIAHRLSEAGKLLLGLPLGSERYQNSRDLSLSYPI